MKSIGMISLGAYDAVIQRRVETYRAKILASESLEEANYWVNSAVTAIAQEAGDYQWTIMDQIKAENELRTALSQWQANHAIPATNPTAPTTPGYSPPAASSPGASNSPAPTGWLPGMPLPGVTKGTIPWGTIGLSVGGAVLVGGIAYVLWRRFGRPAYRMRSGYVT